MRRFEFRYPVWQQVSPKDWLEHWSARLDPRNNTTYFELVAKAGSFSASDFELIGRWKENCLKAGHGGWKVGTPRLSTRFSIRE